MPRYFFHTLVNDELLTDTEGAVLLDPDQAWRAARAIAFDILQSDDAPKAMSVVVVVTDEEGDTVLELPVSDVIGGIGETPSKH